MLQADAFIAVQRMQEYIELNICEKITLKQLANSCGYSPWHAARIFKEITKKAPFDYIRSMRLTKAALALRDEKHRIIDVALDFVFDSHEGFTRAFSKEFGLSPKKYSLTTPPIWLFVPEKVYLTYRQNKKGETIMCGNNESVNENKTTKTIFVQVIERPARKLLLKRGVKATHYFEYCEEVGCDVWALLTSIKEAIYEPIGMWLPMHLIKEGTSLYVQGVELPHDYNNIVPDGFELIDLPPCTIMVFQGEPYDDVYFSDAIGEVWEYIEKFNPSVYGYEWVPEAAPRFQLAPMGYRGYIEARPVRAINRN